MAHKGGWDYETPREIVRAYIDATIANIPALVVLGVLLAWLWWIVLESV